MRKAADFLNLVLHVLLDTVQAALYSRTGSGQTLTHPKYVALGVMPGPGSCTQDGPLRTEFGRAGVISGLRTAWVLRA